MDITFAGAAREVTGSCHIVRVGSSTIALDCGMFQGKRTEAEEKNRRLPLPIQEIVKSAPERARFKVGRATAVSAAAW